MPERKNMNFTQNETIAARELITFDLENARIAQLTSGKSEERIRVASRSHSPPRTYLRNHTAMNSSNSTGLDSNNSALRTLIRPIILGQIKFLKDVVMNDGNL